MPKSAARTSEKTRNMVYIALFAVLMAVCAWISVPAAVPFTMQTFAVFLAVGVLGGRKGTLAVAVYILMGAVGMPVFSHFTGGPGVLFQATGGYILGFLFTALIQWGAESLPIRKPWVGITSMLLGLIACYAFGTLWFVILYTRSTGAIGFGTALLWCVVPYIIPDLIKMALALTLKRRLHSVLKLQ